VVLGPVKLSAVRLLSNGRVVIAVGAHSSPQFSWASASPAA
jgi:hypothetical protein